MKIPEIYEDFLKTPDEELEKIYWMEKTLNEHNVLFHLLIKLKQNLKKKLSEEKKKNVKS